MEREALKLALEALSSGENMKANGIGWREYDCRLVKQAIIAIKEALAQPAQEPVAWMTINAYGEEDDIHYENPEGHLLEGWTYKPLYTHPPSVQPQPVSLRRGDILRCIETDELCTVWATSTTGKTLIKWSANNFGSYTAAQIGELFWLEPAQKTKREWVGLTDEEIKEIIGTWGDTPVKGYTRKLFDQIEAKLRSKNNG